VRAAFLALFVLLLPLCELSLVLWLRFALAARTAQDPAVNRLRRHEAALDAALDLESRIAAKAAFKDALSACSPIGG